MRIYTQSHLNPYSKYDKTEKSYLPWCHGMQYISTVPTRLPQHRNIKFWGIEKVGSFLSAALWPFPLPVPVWVTVWVSQNQHPAKSSQKRKNSPEIRRFRGCLARRKRFELLTFWSVATVMGWIRCFRGISSLFRSDGFAFRTSLLRCLRPLISCYGSKHGSAEKAPHKICAAINKEKAFHEYPPLH